MAKDKDDITETIHELMQIMRKTVISEAALENEHGFSQDPAYKDIRFLLREVNPKWTLEAIARAFLAEKLTWEEYEELDEVCGIIFLLTRRRVPTLLQGARFAAERYVNAEVCPLYLHNAFPPEYFISEALSNRILELEKEKKTFPGFFSIDLKEYKITKLKILREQLSDNFATLESYFDVALQDKKLIEGIDSRTAKTLKYCKRLAATVEHDFNQGESESRVPRLV